ncbi:MAG: sugar transferase [Candidatus Schekmanbacteria bacterium]|nr:sugar transferase [Candidatus Schekmanbacteria bacterium]
MYTILNIPIRKTRLLGFLLFLSETIHIIIFFCVAAYIRYNSFHDISKQLYLIPIFCLVYTSFLYFFDFYNLEFRITKIGLMIRIAMVDILGTCLIIMGSYSFNLLIDKKLLFYWFLIFLFLYPVWRQIFIFITRKPMRPENILIVGNDWSVEELIKEINYSRFSSYDIKSILSENNNDPAEIEGVKVINGSYNLKALVKDLSIDKVVVSTYKEMHKDLITELLDCRLMGIEIIELPNFYRKITGKIPVRHFQNSWFIFSNGFERIRKPFVFKVKRIIDIFLTIVGLIIAAPLMVIIAILIKLDSDGSVFYVQERLGLNEKPFKLIKFRSMTKDAEKESGPVWSMKNDSRVSRVGRLLRPTRLDEIPQLLNVLKGEMTFVGPRPERPFFIERLKKQIPYYSLRFAVKPGITGWAQVKYHYGDSVEDALEKLQYDLYYIQNISLILDIYILLRTIMVVLSGKER